MHTSVILEIDFTDDWFEAHIDVDLWSEAYTQIYEIPYVDQVCINHACWVKATVGDFPVTDFSSPEALSLASNLFAISDEIKRKITGIIEGLEKESLGN